MSAVKINAKEATPVQARFGIDCGPPQGMRPDVDPAALGKNDFVYLQNIRRIGTSVIGRPGQSLFADLSLVGGGEPTGIDQLPTGSNRGLYMVTDGCPGESSAVGFSLCSYSEDQLNEEDLVPTRFFPLVYRSAATTFKAQRFVRAVSEDGLTPAIDAMFFAVDNVLYRLAEIPFPYGVRPLYRTGGTQEVPVWTLPAPYVSIGEMKQFGGSLYISAVNGAGTSAIFAYDGLTFTRVLDAVDPITGFAVFRNILIAGHNGGTNLIRIWNGTSWSTVAPGAGTVKIKGNRCTSYHDVLYIPSDDNIYSFDGIATLTQIPPATTGVDVGAEIFALETFDDCLVGTWTTAAPKARLLEYDGTTWTATVKDFIAQIPGTTAVRALREFHGALMVGALDSGDARLFRSPRRATGGTYSNLSFSSISASADVRDLVRY